MHLTRNSKTIHGPNGTHEDSHGPTDLSFTSQTSEEGPNSLQMDSKIIE
jgi:hypothetical protein